MLINHILSKIVFDRPFFVVGIDGPTASGKTYLADNLAAELNKQNIPNFIFCLDWTLIDRHLRENEAGIFVSTDSPFEYEADYHMDLSRAEKFLKNIVYGFKENEKLKLSGLYSRENGGVCTGETEVLMQNKMVIIVEGHYSHHHSLQKYIDYNLVLLSEPLELLRRKTIRAASYRGEKPVNDYFDYIDMPSYSHFLIQNHRYVTEIFDNTDFENPAKCNLNALHTFIETDYNYCRTKLPDLVEDFFSASSLRNQADFAEVKNAVNLLLKFDYEASLLFGLSENVREKSFTETLQNILKEQNIKLQFCDFKSLYSGVIQYFTVLSISGIRVLFFASSHKIRIVLISGVSKKIYETERVFSQFSSGFSYAGTIFKKVSLLPEQGINLIVPDRFYVSEDKIHNYRKIIPSLSNNPVLFFENFINSEFELLHRFDSPDELRCWFDIFSTAGFSPVFRDNYLYVDGRGTDKLSFVSGYPFSKELPGSLPALTDADITLISDLGLKYVDELIAGDIADEAAFLKLFRESREAVKSLMWEWLIRHFSDCEVFEGLTLRRLHSNFPSQFSDYYFALSLHKNTSVPFFTVYDLRKKSLDVNSYFRLSSKYKTAVGIQASQNALDAESGYLKINPDEGFSERITNILVDFLKNNPGKNIPLWSLGIDHASAKMNKKEGWTGSFLKQAFSQGFVTSVCLDVETLISSREPDYLEIENLIAEWLDVIPVCTDVELATGEKMNLLTPEKLRDLSVILGNALVKSGKDKTVFLLGPALGTAHHAESSNTSPETSRKVSETTKSAGSTGNVLHGTSFTKPEEVAEFVKNNCVRVNFAGQYLAQLIGSLPEETALRFGKNQFEWKTSFAFNNELLEKLEKSEAEKVYNAVESLFLKHHNVLNNIELSKESAEHFRKQVTDIPDSLLKIISAKCFNPENQVNIYERSKPVILASMIEVPYDEFSGGQAKMLYDAGIKNFHIDVGDGVFISRKICGLTKLDYLLENFSDINVHVHIMAESPHLKNDYGISLIEKYANKGVSVIYLYRSSFKNDEDFNLAINQIRNLNVKPGIVYNPDFEFSDNVFNDIVKYNIHNVQLMGVFSGRGGQRFVPKVLKTIGKFRKAADEHNYQLYIEVDGGLTRSIAIQCRNAGADFLSGWSMFLSNGKAGVTKTAKSLLDEI